MSSNSSPFQVPWSPEQNVERPPVEEVRTIFILGFPTDVRERELHNLLRWWPGFEASQMNFKGDQPMGFALFSSRAMALSAKDALQNYVFDTELNAILRTEMAKKNLYVKKGLNPPAEPVLVVDPNNRPKSNPFSSSSSDQSPVVLSTQNPSNQNGPPVSTYWPNTSFLGPQNYPEMPLNYPIVPLAYNSRVCTVPMVPIYPICVFVYPEQIQLKKDHQFPSDNPPCNTLFVGNLSENTSEAELRNIFQRQQGFKQMKVLRQARNTVCFVEMQDVESAISVHSSLQGILLNSSNRGGIRIQFSKNPYGQKSSTKTFLTNQEDSNNMGSSQIPEKELEVNLETDENDISKP